MSEKNTGVWNIFTKDDLSFLSLTLNNNESMEIILRKQDNIFIESFLSPESKHTYFTSTKVGNKKFYITLFPSKQCMVEAL